MSQKNAPPTGRRVVAIVATCCVALGVLLALHHASGGDVQIGCERQGIRIRYVYKRDIMSTYPDIANQHLELLTSNSPTELTRFSQLQGHLYITTTQQALSYVRFRTSLYTFFYWSDSIGFEVISEDAVSKLPSYGLSRYYKPYPGGAGDAGVLSPTAYREGKFTPANVSERDGHFQVIRWIFVLDKVEQVREVITADGGYERTILKQVPLPKLRDTYWRIPSFE